MNKVKQGSPPKFDNAFKIAVAREYLTSDQSAYGLAKKYNLQGHQTVQWFVKWYKKHYDWDGQMEDKSMNGSPSPGSDQQLAKQVKEANLKIAGLEMLIEIASKELGVDIIKKPGTKQSSK